MKNAALTANGLPHGHDGYNQHDQDQSGECLPQQVAGIGVRDETKVSLLRVDKQYHHGRRGRKAQQCGEGEEGGEPAGAVEEVAVEEVAVCGAGEALALADLQCNWLMRTVLKLPTILVVPNVRPLQDRVVYCNGDRGDTHCVQAPRHERCLEPTCTYVQDEELLEGVLEEVQLEEIPEEALERALGEELKKPLKEADV